VIVYRKDVVSDDAFVAHDPGDKRNVLAVWRPGGIGDLQRRLVVDFISPVAASIVWAARPSSLAK